jgi:hypothetical protein
MVTEIPDDDVVTTNWCTVFRRDAIEEFVVT